MRFGSMVLAGLAAVTISTSAYSAVVPDGTLSSVATFNPTINLTSDPSTYSAVGGGTFEISGTGGFASVAGSTGVLNGSLLFANTSGNTVTQQLNNFFTFDDGQNGTYNFSVASVRTNSFVNTADFSSATLYVLGSLVNSNLGYTSTPASLSVQFNSTGGSAYSSALSLAVPPAGVGAVPEPASWALMIGGFGLAGGTLRRRVRRTEVAFA